MKSGRDSAEYKTLPTGRSVAEYVTSVQYTGSDRQASVITVSHHSAGDEEACWDAAPLIGGNGTRGGGGGGDSAPEQSGKQQRPAKSAQLGTHRIQEETTHPLLWPGSHQFCTTQ